MQKVSISELKWMLKAGKENISSAVCVSSFNRIMVTNRNMVATIQ